MVALFASNASALPCSNFSGTYALKDDDDTSVVRFFQDECKQLAIVYDTDPSGKKTYLSDGVFRQLDPEDSGIIEKMKLEGETLVFETVVMWPTSAEEPSLEMMSIHSKITQDGQKNLVIEATIYDKNGDETGWSRSVARRVP